MTAILALFEKLFPYLIAAAIGATLAGWVCSTMDDAVLQKEKAAHMSDNARLGKQIGDMEGAAALADQKAIADHHAQEGRIQTLDDQLTKEKTAHENDARTYATALATGAQRLRIAVRSCSSSSGNDMPATPGAASVDDGAPAYADVDPAVAGRVFAVAADDQKQIDKLKGLQGYVCALQPALPACAQSAP